MQDAKIYYAKAELKDLWCTETGEDVIVADPVILELPFSVVTLVKTIC